MESRYRFRLYLLTALILLGTWSLLHRLHQFQIEEQDYYLLQRPRLKEVSIREPGVRGEITDRNGLALASNEQVYQLVVNLGEVREAWLRQRKTVDTPRQVADQPGEDIARIVESWILPRLAQLEVKPRINRAALRNHFITHGNLVPYVFAGDLNFDQFSRLAERNLDLPGVYVTSIPQRIYPFGTLAGHVIGYVQPWRKGVYTAAEKREYDHYFGDSKGVQGIEKGFNRELTGTPGKRSLYKDEKGQIIGPALDSRPPEQGAQITLTIDAGIQCLVENILRKIGRGAAVVMNPNSGEILALASVPNYDPNDYVPSLSREQERYYNQNLAKPFLNRAVASYQPGSIAKVPVSLVALMNGRVDFQHDCKGFIAYGRTGRKIHCWNSSGHGLLKLDSAIQRSCNPYFMELANQLGSSRIVEDFELMSLGKRTGIGLPEEDPGIVPGSPIWMQRQKPGTRVAPSQIAMIAIGQWQMQASPLQMAAVTCCVANGGRYYQPRLVKEIQSSDGQTIRKDEPNLKFNLTEEGVSPADLEVVRFGMWKAANEAGGTATRVALADFPVAAKTGTVQIRKAEPKKNNSWITTFAPFDEPRYVVTVFVEGGASGGKVAGPLAHLILRGIAASESGLKLPAKQMRNFAGHLERIEAIELPQNSLLSIPLEDAGETGDEVSEALQSEEPIQVKPRIIPLPSQEEEGSEP